MSMPQIPLPAKRAALLWIGVYPTITVLLAATTPIIGHWPLALKTLAVTAVMVPLIQFAVMPFLTARFADWLAPKKQSNTTD